MIFALDEKTRRRLEAAGPPDVPVATPPDACAFERFLDELAAMSSAMLALADELEQHAADLRAREGDAP